MNTDRLVVALNGVFILQGDIYIYICVYGFLLGDTKI